MTTITTTRTTVTTTRSNSPGGGHAGPNGRSHERRGNGGGQSGGGRGGGQGTKSVRSSGGGGGGCGGGCLSGVVQWLALAGAIIILVAWILRCLVARDSGGAWASSNINSPNLWFEFLFVAFICLMVILGGFGIGGLDAFLEEYLQWTISPLGKGILILLFCCRVWVLDFSFANPKDVPGTIASILCIAAAVLGVLVLLVGLGVA